MSTQRDFVFADLPEIGARTASSISQSGRRGRSRGDSPTLFATDRTDRVTYIAQGWKVTDPEASPTSAGA